MRSSLLNSQFSVRIPHHVLTAPHWSSLLLIEPHCTSLVLIEPHCSSLVLIEPHCSSLDLIGPHRQVLLSFFAPKLLLIGPHWLV